jgi:hypothetical protein
MPRTLAFVVFGIVYSASTHPSSLYLVGFAEDAAADVAVSVVHLVLVLDGSGNSAGAALDH